MTLSTVGIVPAMERLATEPVTPNLAISLHATAYPLEQNSLSSIGDCRVEPSRSA